MWERCHSSALAMELCLSCTKRSICYTWPPASTKLKGGYTGFTLSVCPSVDRIVSALYLQQYLWDPFHIHILSSNLRMCVRVMFVSKFKKLKFWRILSIYNFDLVFICLGIQCDSIVWLIMGRGGRVVVVVVVSSERRHSSCSSFDWISIKHHNMYQHI